MLQLAVLRKSAVNVVADCNTVQCMFRCTWGKWSCTCTNLRWRTHPSATKLCRVTFLEKLELCVILALGSIPASAAFVYLASSRHVGTFPSLFFVGLGFSWSECWLVHVNKHCVSLPVRIAEESAWISVPCQCLMRVLKPEVFCVELCKRTYYVLAGRKSFALGYSAYNSVCVRALHCHMWLPLLLTLSFAW